jgi:Flp pilus assembly protein TadG
MNTPNTARDTRKSRKGAIAALTALLLMAILGLIACALDIGWIEMTRTQLQAVADASSLAGGTELLDGLGYFATKTPDEVVDAATPVAVEYAGYNRNAELAASFIDGDRDVAFGKATFDDGCNCWQKTPASEGAEYYNYIEIAALRNQAGSTAGDGPAPLFFARIFGINDKSLRATATAAILPADGFQVNEGSNDTANVMPFAFKEELWDRHKRAQEYIEDHPDALSLPPSERDDILDVDGPYPDEPLLGAYEDKNGNGVYDGGTEYVQLFFDHFTRLDTGAVSSAPDGILEVNIYPKNLKVGEETSGNFGTVDFGASNNSTTELSRQILEGLNADDLSYFENNELVMSAEDPLEAEGDTGISAGLKAALEQVIGQCKAIALFTSVEGPGNNAVYELVEFVSATVVRVNFSGQLKELRVQRCRLVDDNAVADTDDEIGEDTTIFTPLILIR